MQSGIAPPDSAASPDATRLVDAGRRLVAPSPLVDEAGAAPQRLARVTNKGEQ